MCSFSYVIAMSPYSVIQSVVDHGKSQPASTARSVSSSSEICFLLRMDLKIDIIAQLRIRDQNTPSGPKAIPLIVSEYEPIFHAAYAKVAFAVGEGIVVLTAVALGCHTGNMTTMLMC